ncbi:MAG: cobalamin B12-binding domain-containing protein [Verrucomicrobia bacterium]|nr:cobalamin B12-binding domain-containing protein [Verrucomicrobiota bacterium]
MSVASPPRLRPAPLRVLTAVPLCDGHDSAIVTINLELARHGAEVIYLGYHQAASAIARAAVQEDVHAVGLSSYNGGHRVFFREVRAQLRARGAADIPIFGGGGGTITAADARVMQRSGVDRIFFAGTPLAEMTRAITGDYARELRPDAKLRGDRALARAITLAESRSGLRPDPRKTARQRTRSASFVVGVAGPGGAGKSTLIDELAARFLRARRSRRLAILANDPSHPETRGAILGDRVSALYAQDERVFFRSLATRGSLTGLSAAAPAAIEILRRRGGFDLIFVESVGVGQESDPFRVFRQGEKLVDAVLFVLPPHYGGRIQLQKIALLDGADLVVLNKCDDPRASAAKAELGARLAANGRNQLLHTTIAAQHRDPGTDALCAAIGRLAGLESAGGEKPCHLCIGA